MSVKTHCEKLGPSEAEGDRERLNTHTHTYAGACARTHTHTLRLLASCAVKQLRSPRLFVQSSHQTLSGGCGHKEEEIAVNLWVIENVYIPSRVHFYLLYKQPFYLCDPHLLQQAPGWKPFPTLPSGSHWMLVPIAGVGGVTHLCACLHCLHLLSAAGIDARLLFLPAQGVKWFVWRLGVEGGDPSGA